MGGLKRLAFDGIAEHIDSLGPPELVEETFSVFTSRQGGVTNILAQLLMYLIGTRNSMVSTSSGSDRSCHSPPDPKTLFGTNYPVIFLGSFHIVGKFSHPYYRPSWMDLLPGTLVLI